MTFSLGISISSSLITGAFSAIFSSISELYSISQLNSEEVSTKRYKFELVLTIIAGIVAFLLPSSFGFTLIKIAGGLLIIIAIVMAISIYKNSPIIIKNPDSKE
mgnify:CR=1 FL=1